MRPLDMEYQEAMELCQRKNKDYGNAKDVMGKVYKILFPNGVKLETANQFGEFAVFQMIMTKVLRFANLSQSKGMPNFESVDDTLKDLGNYAFILKNMIANNQEDELQQTEGLLCTCGHREVDHVGGHTCEHLDCPCKLFTKAGD